VIRSLVSSPTIHQGLTRSELRHGAITDSYRFFGSFRLLLAVMVLGQHLHWLAPGDIGREMESYCTGDIGVLMFFVLSGFVISEAADLFYKARPFAFLGNRMLRIMPPFLFAFAICALCSYALVSAGTFKIGGPRTAAHVSSEMFLPRNLAANVLYLIPGMDKLFGEPTYFFIPITWAIRTEMAFYFTVFAALLASGRRLRLEVVMFVLALGQTGLYALWLFKGFPHLARYGPYFGLGVSLYYAITGRRVAWILSGVFFGEMLYDFSIYGVPLGTNRLAMPKVVAQYALLTACASVMAVLPHLRGSIAARKMDSALGDLSYPFYLNQVAVILTVNSLIEAPSVEVMIAASIIVLLVSIVADRAVEPLFAPLRNRLRGRTLASPRRAEPAPIESARYRRLRSG
jgi:peptidoglycan/LPS O-acetylase OafA/YrhL